MNELKLQYKKAEEEKQLAEQKKKDE